MHASQRFSDTFPNGYADLLDTRESRRHQVGGYELRPERLALFNNAVRRISPQALPLELDQIASAARRVFDRYRGGEQSAFVASRMNVYERLRQLAGDPGWNADIAVHERIKVVQAYVDNPDDLLPDYLPSIGLLDDALLIDVTLQVLREEIADYEDFCNFRQVAADFAGVAVEETGLDREQWLQALQLARQRHQHWAPEQATRFGPADPRASLFHIT